MKNVRHKTWILVLGLLITTLLSPSVAAQGQSAKGVAAKSKGGTSADDVAARQLETLLLDLSRLPEGAWKKRIGVLQVRIATEEARRAKLEKQAKKLRDKAKASSAVAEKFRAELARLEKLRPLLVKMTRLHPEVLSKRAVVDAAATAKAVTPAKAPKKVSAGKSKPRKIAAKKPAPKKKSVAKKKPATKKPTTKKPATKKPAIKKKPAPKKSSKPKPAAEKLATKSVQPKLDALLTWANVEPIFEEHCMSCHETGDAEGGLDLTSFATLLSGGGSGKTLVPGNVDGSRLYRLVSHKEKPTMPPDEPRIDKKFIATIRTWIEQGAPETKAAAVLLAKKRVVAAAAARRLADARAKKAKARVRTAPMPTAIPPLERRLAAHAVSVKTIATSPLAPVVAIPGFGQVLLHHAETNANLGTLPFEFGRIEVLRFTADGRLLLAAGGQAGRKGGAVLYDVKTGAVLRRIKAGFDSVLAADATAERIALGGSRKRVDVYSVADGSRLYRVSHDDWVLALDFDDAGKLLASADRTGKVVVTQADTGRNVHDLLGHKTAVNALAFAPGVGLLASAGEDRSVRVWRMKDGRQLWSKTSHRRPVVSLAWLNTRMLASGSADGTVRAWKSNGSVIGKAKVIGEWVYGLAASSSGKRLFAGDWSGRVSVYDVKTGKLALRFSPTRVSQ